MKRKRGPKTPEGKARAIANLNVIEPGEVRNPNGRKAAGLYVTEWVNVLANEPESTLRKIVRDVSLPTTKRMAAKRLLNAIESTDLADFEPLLKGETSLQKLRESGIDTSVVKKIKAKSKVNLDADGEPETVMEREIELHDRSGDDFDRILDRTVGKPKQETTITHDGAIRTTAEGETAADQVIARLREALGN